MCKKDYRIIGVAGLFLLIALFYLQCCISKVETNSALLSQQTEYKENPAPDMPNGYIIFGEGTWITDDTWQCLAIMPDTTKVGISEEYSIKELTIHVIGGEYGYIIQPLYNTDGTILKIPYDGNAWG